MKNRKPWTDPGDRFDRALGGYNHTRTREIGQQNESMNPFYGLQHWDGLSEEEAP
jgi:hypothetical protein